ncbi:galactose-1-phosphate uridylyltransferase [Streptoalloteichus hindustanus]|uniref:UDPglucose--hexose-1-phosphate uridylyltransferase n=1 Tax=Streptoalloteichus hindustanus TaxID=2017 RepID=A0A1M5DUD4_STRHI|nr:hypothetical protein [Streptoalloteichus hindustanus]SHF70535.1 UDPglucose--hexose-1-phosphate uridylyltransferase [Streptoalloteichus hindustanus]
MDPATTSGPASGAELRWDPARRDWVVVAADRTRRPHDAGGAGCPFCPGPTEDTPAEIWRLSDGQGWRVRVVPNRYPIAAPDATTTPPPPTTTPPPLLSSGHGGFRRRAGRGHHEVVIESPRHDWDLATAGDDEVLDVLLTWRERARALRARSAQVVLFRNHGAASGTSLSHPHSQVVSLPVLPAHTRRRIHAAREHHRRTGRPLGSDVLDRELADGRRILLETPDVVVLAPFAGTSNAELWLQPRTPRADVTTVPDSELADIAACLRQALAALRTAFDDPPYNLVVDTAPRGWEGADYLSWQIRIVPRLTTLAGFELATGVPVLTLSPEEAVTRLRAAAPPAPTPARTGPRDALAAPRPTGAPR